ncbi:uncharacterized protein LOC131989594 isoform X2 [Centropristis striata]|uniref:uncharacterized protein LOC131989594 isoform X2 n=1 Tax=Centropristis striata TaxID=184440 RepID=UPI0027DF1E24|nr:uncharacterized protein LOC131989594 isoform X2 [Centropristis striata]
MPRSSSGAFRCLSQLSPNIINSFCSVFIKDSIKYCLFVNMKSNSAFFFFFLLLLGSSVPPAAGNPLQRGSPVRVSAVAGRDVVLPCGVSAWDGALAVSAVEWTRVDGPSPRTVLVLRDGEELQREQEAEFSGRTAALPDGALQLLHVERRDSGTYRCIVLRGRPVEEELFVSLLVVQVSQVSLSVRRSSSNQLLVLCESGPWSLEPRVSLLDSGGLVLSARVESSQRPDDLHNVIALLSAAKGTLTCRAEIPGTHISSNISVHISDFFFGLIRRDADGRLDFGDIRLVRASGASEETARANELICKGACGVSASRLLAESDLKLLLRYKDMINSVGQTLGVAPALLAAIMSRQSRAGAELREDGFGRVDGDCFGLMQINRRYHPLKGAPCSREHVDQGATFLIQMMKVMKRTKPDWDQEQKLKGALACYVAGEDKVIPLTFDLLDSVTPHRDFSNDVIARAQWLSDHF